jgi:hypothetical protein
MKRRSCMMAGNKLRYCGIWRNCCWQQMFRLLLNKVRLKLGCVLLRNTWKQACESQQHKWTGVDCLRAYCLYRQGDNRSWRKVLCPHYTNCTDELHIPQRHKRTDNERTQREKETMKRTNTDVLINLKQLKKYSYLNRKKSERKAILNNAQFRRC